jgi:NAD(P)-dependent dehydrogenase (short-subunit alcohol dehydrogenase family)
MCDMWLTGANTMSTRIKKQASGPLGWTPPNLKGKVAVVAGGSRGSGRGIALALGETGATVYVSGRSTREGPKPFDGAPGTIEQTAEAVTRRGGHGIPVRCDHTIEADVEALFERIEHDHGRLDLLANGVWGSSAESSAIWNGTRKPFWEFKSNGWQETVVGGAYAALLATTHAARLMAPRGRGLIVHVTEPIFEEFGRITSLFWLFNMVGHRSINQITEVTAPALAKRNIAIIALAPGFMRTERVLKHIETMTEKQKQAYRFELSETTEYVGRAVASLAADANILPKTGKLLYGGDLAVEYGFKDSDGKAVGNFYRKAKMVECDARECSDR